MKPITLATMFVLAGSAITVASAQDPTPPAPPARPAKPAPAPAPAPAVRVPRLYPGDIDIDDVVRSARDMADQTRDFARIEANAMRDFARIDANDARDFARDFARDNADLIREASRLGAQAARLDMPRGFAPLAPLPPLPGIPAGAPMANGLGGAYDYDYNNNFEYAFNNSNFDFSNIARGRDGFPVHAPPAPWAQDDPADSVYRIARDALSRGEYGRAAKMFEDIRSKYPKSAYQSDSQYYEAYARYKIGTTDELHTASNLLEPIASKVITTNSATSSGTSLTNGFFQLAKARGASDNEVAALYARINGVLAQRGDKSAADKVAKFAARTGASACDNDDVQVQVEAMNALSQMDPNGSLPLLKRVLDRKDECSAELRRRAVFMLGRRADNESAQLLIATAKTDPSLAVRVDAINALPRLPGDVGLNALEDVLRTEPDERIQRAIVRSLSSSDNQKARSSVRALIDRKDASINLRIEAINTFNNDRSTSDDAAYLRSLYAKADNDRIKDAIIGAVGRMGGPDNDKWVLAIAQNSNEPSQLRSTAISRLIRSNVSIADLDKLYDSADSYNVRQQIVSVLGNRKEPEATDKLIDIVRNSTVTNIRTQAINALARKNDPRSVELLNNLLDGKKP